VVSWQSNFKRLKAILVALGLLICSWAGCRGGGETAAHKSGGGSWEKCLGGGDCEYAYDVCPLPGGGFAVVADRGPREGEPTDILLILADGEGNPAWERVYGGNGWDRAYGLLSLPGGGFLVVGDTNSFGAGLCDAYAIRTDAEGRVLWDRTVGGPEDDWVYSVAMRGDGGFMLAGQTESLGPIPTVLLVRLDGEGNVLWSKALELGRPALANEIKAAGSGFVLAGWIMGGGGDLNAWAALVDPEGKLLWERELGEGGEDWFGSVAVLADGSFLFAGSTTPGAEGERHILLAGIDDRGNITWHQALSEEGEAAHRVCTLGNGGVALAGSARSPEGKEVPYLLVLDPGGAPIFREAFSDTGCGWFYSVAWEGDGGLVAAGRADSTLQGNPDILLARRAVESL